MKKIINTLSAPSAIGPYSQAVEFGKIVFFSGQIAINPENGELVQSNIEAETEQVMNNIGALLKEVNCDYSHIVKSSIFLSDMNNFSRVNEVYARYFEKDYPARETVEVAGLPKGVNVEISVVVGLS